MPAPHSPAGERRAAAPRDELARLPRNGRLWPRRTAASGSGGGGRLEASGPGAELARTGAGMAPASPARRSLNPSLGCPRPSLPATLVPGSCPATGPDAAVAWTAGPAFVSSRGSPASEEASGLLAAATAAELPLKRQPRRRRRPIASPPPRPSACGAGSGTAPLPALPPRPPARSRPAPDRHRGLSPSLPQDALAWELRSGAAKRV